LLTETIAGESRSVAGHWVFISVNPGTSGYIWTTSDESGRYTAQVPPGRAFVGAWHLPDRQQRCLASATVTRDTALDVEVVPSGTVQPLPPAPRPTITGIVYETDAQGRRPLRDVWVSLDALPFQEVPVAVTQTDESGRFVLCRVNAPVGLVVSDTEHNPFFQLLNGVGDMSLEIELSR
jgi:hypothetical protein